MKRLLLGVIIALALTVPLSAWPWSTYTLTVMGGTGSGKYKSGAKVSLVSDIAPSSCNTLAWMSAGRDLVWGNSPQAFDDPHAQTTVFTMPNRDTFVQVTCSVSE